MGCKVPLEDKLDELEGKSGPSTVLQMQEAGGHLAEQGLGAGGGRVQGGGG